MICFSLKMIKFLDQVLLSLLVKTVMGHKKILFPGFFFLLVSAFKLSLVCLSRALVQDRALRGRGSFTACRIPMAPCLLLGKQVPGGYCTRGVYGAQVAVKRQGREA